MSYDNIRIVSNNHWHNFLSGYELSETEKQEFDYVEDIDSASFLRYRGNVYYLGEFMANSNVPEFHPFLKWHGHISDSYFSGVLIRCSSDCEQYQIARFYS